MTCLNFTFCLLRVELMLVAFANKPNGYNIKRFYAKLFLLTNQTFLEFNEFVVKVGDSL